MSINKSDIHYAISSIIVAALMFAHPAIGGENEISLTSRDGSIDLIGGLVGLERGHYVLETALGELRINSDSVSCEGAACPPFGAQEADVRFVGSNTVGLGLMPLALEGYASYRDAALSKESDGSGTETLFRLVAESGFGDDLVSFQVSSTITEGAFETLLADDQVIGMASRRIMPDEARAIRDVGAGNMIDSGQEHIIAIDSLVAITSPSNPLEEISLAQLADVFAGRITNWSELGGDDLPITVVNHRPGSGTRSVFYDAVFNNGAPDVTVPGEIIAQDNDSAARIVTGTPGALGFVGHAFQRGAKPLKLINECGMRTEPNVFSAKMEEYALQRRLYLYNREGALAPAAENFIEFLMSGEADDVIAKAGFIDLGITRKPQDLNGPRARTLLDRDVDAYEGRLMRELLAEMVNYDRLSTTFRFRTGASRLDQRGELDMKRVIEYMQTLPAGTKVLFVGFTDSVGAFEGNRSLSLSRARKVAQEVQSLAGAQLKNIEISTAGFGELAPSACNISESGRAVNRRVEVWIEASHPG